MTDIVILVATFIIIFLGVIGTLVPMLPGLVLIFIAILGYAWYVDFQNFDSLFIVSMFIIVIVGQFIDYIGASVGAKKYASSRATMAGAILGAVIGLFVIGPLGIIVGPLLLVMFIELIRGTEIITAFKAGISSMIGALGGIVIRFILALVMTISFVFKIL